jgi:hypothetical protein
MVQVNRRQNIFDLRTHDMKPGKNCYLLADKRRCDIQLSHRICRIFLQNLNRESTGALAKMLIDQVQGNTLSLRIP